MQCASVALVFLTVMHVGIRDTAKAVEAAAAYGSTRRLKVQSLPASKQAGSW